MPSEPDTSALQRFARDLRRIREDREVTLDSVHTATQVPHSQLQSFEAGTLYEQSNMTPVYLQGFVQAYAEAVGLPPDPVLGHLESALSGEYDNQLAVEYLGVPPSAVGPDSGSESPDASSKKANEGTPQRPSGPREVEENAPPTPAAGAGESSEEPDSSEDPSQTQASSRPSGTNGLGSKPRSTLFAAIISLVVLGAAGALITVYLEGTSPPSDSASEPARRGATSEGRPSPDSQAVTDSTEAKEPTPPRPRTDVTLGDTLHITVLATADVREIRVQKDDDLRRPYWIEKGEAKVFPFVRRITLQNRLDSLRLLLERYPYPVSRTDDEGRIVITRDTAQQFFDTLRTSPSAVPVSPDTVRGNSSTLEADSL